MHDGKERRSSEIHYRRIFEAARDGILILDAETGTVVDVNQFLIDMLGYSREQFLEKKVWDLGFFKDIVANRNRFLELQQKEYIRYEDLPLETADGRRIDVEFISNVYVVNHEKVIQCSIRDITERKRADGRLREKERYFRSLMYSMHEDIVVIDWDYMITDVNNAFLHTVGRPREEVIGKHCYAVSHGYLDRCDLHKERCAAREVFVTGEPRTCRHVHTRTDGSKVHMDILFSPVKDEAGRVTRVVEAIRDVTDLMAAHEALAQHAMQVQALLDLRLLAHEPRDQIMDFVLDASMSMTQSAYSFAGAIEASESVMTVDRWSKGAMAKCAISTQSIEYPICAAGLWGECVRQRKPVICNDYLAPHPSKKGLPEGHVPIHRFLAVPVLDAGRIVVVAAVANKEEPYTSENADALSTLMHKTWEILARQETERERKSLEEQLHQAQKMESIGQLAGGVAHDFNNILQAIVGYADLLLDRLPERDKTREFAENIVHSAERASSLTRQLLAFSRRQVLEMEDLDLNEVVDGLFKMLKRMIGEDIEVEIPQGRRLGIVHADRGQMEQVLLNLCVNARDAMPEGGALTIETENVAMDSKYCEAHAWASPGRYVLLSVTDTGCGMDAETQAHIFEPFFTTKEMGKGTGLGLATVYGIVRQHQGMIQVYSEVGKGTTFKVYLPSLERAASPVETKAVTRSEGGTETILVAEDDETLRKLAVRIFEGAGYTVLPAVNGSEALDVFNTHAAGIDLVLLDVVMPKMGGKAVYDVLRQQHPGLRFLFSSGYSTSAIHTDFALKAGIDLIQKPYAPDALLRKVREVLHRTDEGPASESDPREEKKSPVKDTPARSRESTGTCEQVLVHRPGHERILASRHGGKDGGQARRNNFG